MLGINALRPWESLASRGNPAIGGNRPTPVFNGNLHLERHIFIATATVRAASQDRKHMFYAKPDSNRLYVMNLLNCLVDADRTEILRRQRRWPAITVT